MLPSDHPINGRIGLPEYLRLSQQYERRLKNRPYRGKIMARNTCSALARMEFLRIQNLDVFAVIDSLEFQHLPAHL